MANSIDDECLQCSDNMFIIVYKAVTTCTEQYQSYLKNCIQSSDHGIRNEEYLQCSDN